MRRRAFPPLVSLRLVVPVYRQAAVEIPSGSI